MSISVPNTISDLTYRASNLGILSSIKGSRKDGSFMKDDLVVPIRRKILEDKYGLEIPKQVQLIQEIKSPMLSKRIEEVKEDISSEIWESPDWYLEEKINGIRCIMIKCGDTLSYFSRECSRETLMPINMPVNISTKEINISSIPDFIIDCEIVSESILTCSYLSEHGVYASSNTQALEILLTSISPNLSMLLQKDFDFDYKIYAFDCIYYNNEWIINQSLSNRRKVLDYLIQLLNGIPIQSVLYTNTDKKAFYNKCISYGMEGCIAKRADSIYIPDTKRNSNGWIKIKKSPIKKKKISLETILNSRSKSEEIISNKALYLDDLETTGFHDTIDAFITGFTVGEKGSFSEGMIYSVELSVMVGEDGYENQQVLCNVHHMDYEVREQLTNKINDIVTLNPLCYNAVVEIDAQCESIIRFRYDKNFSDCTMNSETFSKISTYNKT